MPVAGFRPYVGQRAATYEALRKRQPEWTRERAIVEAAVAGMWPGETLLDAPVGTGRFLTLYAERGLTVTGLDSSSDMLAEARRKGTTATLLKGDLTGDVLRTVGGFVDYAICLRLLNWLTPAEAEQAVGQLLRVTRRAVWLSVCTDETAGLRAKSAETHAEAAVHAWIAAAGWQLAAQHVIAQGARRLYAVWEVRRADR